MQKLALLSFWCGAPLLAQVQILEPAAAALFAVDAKVETLSTKLQFCEGPVWVRALSPTATSSTATGGC